MKRLWNSVAKPTKNLKYQAKAIQHVEDLEKSGERANPAPKHATEKKFFEKAQQNEEVKKALTEKNAKLVENMQKLKISSTDPPERWTKSNKELPSRESEFLHRNDPQWEFGFYEPPLDKMQPGKIMFREALEALRTMQEAKVEGDSEVAANLREDAQTRLSEHAGYTRVGVAKMEVVYQYFRPFERKDTQRVVNKLDLQRLQDLLQGRGDETHLLDMAESGSLRRLLQEKKESRDIYDKMDSKEREQLEDAIKVIREEETERLQKRLQEVDQMEKALDQTLEEAKKKTGERSSLPEEKS